MIIKGIRVCLETKSEKEIKVSSVNTNICQVLAFFFVWADLFIDYLIWQHGRYAKYLSTIYTNNNSCAEYKQETFLLCTVMFCQWCDCADTVCMGVKHDWRPVRPFYRALSGISKIRTLWCSANIRALGQINSFTRGKKAAREISR